ncbi:MAG: hypothetical protein JRI23_15830 [Deltaproteobacteria bacterium]|jgi:hypothetical protein|nr:hypothetical protein [Deltaproteobacteria bacterium]MBW2533234.1 hypothetical protein [Deltaproteobacteria bacterium]
MPKITQAFAAALIVLGIAGYALSGAASVTALIPAFLGAPVLVFGLLAARPGSRRGLWMHLAVGVMFVGLLGTARALPGAIALVMGGEVARPGAVVAQVVMALLCLAYVLLAVRSFVQARRERSASSA